MLKKIVGLGFSSKGKKAKNVKEYINSLIKAGAGEFFVGYNPPYWYQKFGFEVSPNGRFAEHEQVTDIETFKEIVQEIHSNGLEVFANLNAWYYTPETMPLIEKMFDELMNIQIDGIICGNIGILEFLKKKNYKGKINISTILAIYNKESIKFFIENYNINKFILSREITLREIEELALEFPEMKFEVFGEGDFCRYNNGLCFAEHKYGVKDICTIVVDDLVIKKRFKPNFKEFILDKNLSNEEKLNLMNDDYKSDFEKIGKLIEEKELGLKNKETLEENLVNLLIKQKNNPDLYFDILKNLESIHNKNVLVYIRGLKILKNDILIKNNLDNFLIELLEDFKNYINYHKKKIKELGGEAKVKALELATFYGRGDKLNLYNYLFFSKISNIDTVKFPTRGRNYADKIQLIDKISKEGKIENGLIDETISLDRAHYDLTYIFKDKLRFKKLRKNIINN